eukprot:14179867-Alexandrium_andersonii.AAC.1
MTRVGTGLRVQHSRRQSGEQHARTDARASAGSGKTGLREQHTRSNAHIPQQPTTCGVQITT